MKGASDRIKRMAGWFIRPAPSFFDLCLAGFLILPYIRDGYRQEIFFIFYIIFLVCISMGQKPIREYHSLPLMLLSLWALIGVFIHSYLICEESITMRYLNMYLLSEGFIYILFGSLFITMVVKYSRNMRIFYLLIPFGLIPMLLKQISPAPLILIYATPRNFTLWGSIGISITLYFALRRKWLYTSILASIGLILAFLKRGVLMSNWQARPYAWGQLIREIIKHPFVGSGFYHGLEHPKHMIWIEYQNHGWLFRHNDYLSLGAYLGIFATICVMWFLINSAKKIGIRPALIPVLIIIIMSFFQLNMFRIERAGPFLLIASLCLKQGYQKEE